MTQHVIGKAAPAAPSLGNHSMRARIACCCLSLSLVFALASPALASDSLTWRADQNRVDADIRAWSLLQLLERIAAMTGWQVFVDPGASHTASTKFKDLPVNDALGRLLGQLNFALVPQTNAKPRLLVFRTSLQDATQPVKPEQPDQPAEATGKRIANELIVALKPGASIDELARALGAKVVGRLDSLNAYRLQFEDEAAAAAARAKLQSDPQIASVDYNYSVDRPVTGTPLLASSSSPPQLKLRPPGDKDRIIIGLIDTPIQPLGGDLDQFLLKSISLAGETKPDPNWPTHGTEMANAILNALQKATGGRTSVQILPVDVYGNNPSTTTFDVALGIYQAINAGANPINLSLGGEVGGELLHSVIQQGHNQGVLFFAAAGNAPVTTPTFPAAYPEVVAVTAGDSKGQIADYANSGSFVDVVAPSGTVINYQGQPFFVSGTSASTALVTGTAAGQADANGKSLTEVEADLRAGSAVGSNASR